MTVLITTPDGVTQNFGATLSNSGSYRSIISINENSLDGIYQIDLSHNGAFVKSVSFVVTNPTIPDWIKNNAKWWGDDLISDDEFISALEYLVKKGIIRV